jgi:hypothetical protein
MTMLRFDRRFHPRHGVLVLVLRGDGGRVSYS